MKDVGVEFQYSDPDPTAVFWHVLSYQLGADFDLS
jgi:hypothetical protein